MTSITMLPSLSDDTNAFPPPESALKSPNGLLAYGGDLSAPRLLAAYRQGIFPWYGEDSPILWWSPDPRCVLYLEDLIVSRSLKKAIKSTNLTIAVDQDFQSVLQGCAQPRKNHQGTWLIPEMQTAYSELFALNYAHSVEVYKNKQLVGGIYGIALGRLFFGESMFSFVPNASKIALYHLVQLLKRKNFLLIDCQVPSSHLFTLGARLIPRKTFLNLVAENNEYVTKLDKWTLLDT